MKEKLYIHGGNKIRKKGFDYLAPIGKEELEAATDVIKRGRLSGFYRDFLGGEKVQEFENKFAHYTGVKYAIAVNSGTSALHVAIDALGIGPGDEVIVPSFTFTATASAVLMNNAIPIFVDIEPETLCIDPKEIKKVINKKTKAVIPVHIYGKVANMDEILMIAKENKLSIIEDACQAPGCKYRGKKVGSLGDTGVFSFVETKNIVIGEGGMITTNNSSIAERCRLIRNHGEAWVYGKPREYLSNMLGYNFRMTEICAAMGIEQLAKLDCLNKIRKDNASFLQKELSKFRGIKPMKFYTNEVCHIFPIIFEEEEVGISRERFIDIMNSEGIPLASGYPRPLYKNPIFQEEIAYGSRGCPYTCSFYGEDIDYKNLKNAVTEEVCRKLLCIRQIHYPYGIKDMMDIIKAFKKVFYNLDKLK